MTRTPIYEVGDTLIPNHVVLKWDDTYGNVYKNGHLLLIFFSYNVGEWLYSTITSTYTQLFYITTYIAGLTNLTALLPQSHDCSCYVSRPILTPPPF